jgi:hypothetical protein
MQRSEFWPDTTAHRSYWERHNCSFVYEYDPTDDGPEVEILKAIHANHDPLDLLIEQESYKLFCLLIDLFLEIRGRFAL